MPFYLDKERLTQMKKNMKISSFLVVWIKCLNPAINAGNQTTRVIHLFFKPLVGAFFELAFYSVVVM